MMIGVHPHLLYRFEMIDSARNKLRVKAAYLMIAATLAACGVMVFLGKRVSHRHSNTFEFFHPSRHSLQQSQCSHLFLFVFFLYVVLFFNFY